MPPAIDSSGSVWRFRLDVEGLRAIAVLAVVLFHSDTPGFASGFLGVDVFFVLSGYLITGVLLYEISTTGALSLRAFWARRIRRLLPAAAVVILTVLIVDAFLSSPVSRAAHARTALAAALYVPNVLFALRSRLYFAQDLQRDPLLHTWSLAVEEQFYLVSAPALAMLAVYLRTAGDPGLRRYLAAAAAAATVLSLAAAIAVSDIAPVWSFYLLPTRVWEFGVGALCALVPGSGKRLPGPVRTAGGVIALFVLIAAMLLPPSALSHPGWGTVIPVLATATLILVGRDGTTVAARIASTAPLPLLGRLSYSWYLWHWPVLVFAALPPATPSAAARLLWAAASLVPAAATFVLVENPIRFSRMLAARPGATIVGGLLLTATLTAAASLAVWRAGEVYEEARFAPVRAALDSSDPPGTRCGGHGVRTTLQVCTIGASASDSTIVLIGDSHAGHWIPALSAAADARGWRLVSITRPGCPAVGVTILQSPSPPRGNAQCDAWRAAAIEWVMNARPTAVVLGSYRGQAIITPDGRAVRPDSSRTGRALWQSGLERTLAALQPSGAHIVVIAATPVPRIDIPDCVARHLDESSRCDVPRAAAVDDLIVAAERSAVARHPTAVLHVVNDAACERSTCPAMVDGIIRYSDTNHLSAPFVRSLASAIAADAFQAALRP